MNADDPAALDAMVDRFATAADRRSRRPCCPHLLCLRGEALRTRFQREGSTADIEDSVHCLHQALEGFPSDGHLRASVLSALGAALTLRFRRTATPADLDPTYRSISGALLRPPRCPCGRRARRRRGTQRTMRTCTLSCMDRPAAGDSARHYRAAAQGLLVRRRRGHDALVDLGNPPAAGQRGPSAATRIRSNGPASPHRTAGATTRRHHRSRRPHWQWIRNRWTATNRLCREVLRVKLPACVAGSRRRRWCVSRTIMVCRVRRAWIRG